MIYEKGIFEEKKRTSIFSLLISDRNEFSNNLGVSYENFNEILKKSKDSNTPLIIPQAKFRNSRMEIQELLVMELFD